MLAQQQQVRLKQTVKRSNQTGDTPTCLRQGVFQFLHVKNNE